MNEKQYDQHMQDYIQFNHEQTEWWEEQQLRQARHAQWLQEFMSTLPFEIKTEM